MKLPGGPTRDEILAIALFKMDLQPGDRFMDIGCGTGKVSLNAAPRVKRVSAIDLREEAIIYARREAEKAGVSNIEFIQGNAAELIPLLPRPDCAFLGGSRDLSLVLPLLARRNVRTIVVNAIKLDTINTAISLMQELGVFREAVYVQVSHASPIGTGFMWKPDYPVAIIVGGAARCS